MAKLTATKMRSILEYYAERLQEAANEGGLSASACDEHSRSLFKALNDR